MGNLLRILLLTVLCIVLGLLLLALLLMTPRTGVHLFAGNGRARMMVFYGPLHKMLDLSKDRKKTKSKPKQEEKAEKPAEEKPKKPGVNLKNLDIGQAVTDVLDLLGQAKDILRIDILRADVTIATGDAARTGLILGYSAALGGMIYPFLEQTFHIKDFHVAVDGDFQGEKTRYEIELSASFRPIAMLWLGVRSLPLMYRYYRTLTQKMEANAA